MIARSVALACLFAAILGAQGRLVDGPFVLVIGPPGSGKSTQGVLAAKKLGVPVVSVDELTEANREVFEKTRRGVLSGMEPETDPRLNPVFAKRLEKGDLAKGAVIEGYPATKDHADFLAKMISERKLPSPVILQLTVPDEVARKRLEGAPGKTPESVEQRLKDYYRELGALSLYFPDADVNPVDGSMSPEEVAAAISKIIEQKF